ncbi:unnamed protein product [Dibothriocephalus latus]|uniref:Uncharacterized protein n=1 Tax=Dibothriocephalus latus TaxID=60516 RepID=A0A3P7QB56_DIBLA|nr:unnamed protein product [Dibothriocephalus latus]
MPVFEFNFIAFPEKYLNKPGFIVRWVVMPYQSTAIARPSPQKRTWFFALHHNYTFVLYLHAKLFYISAYPELFKCFLASLSASKVAALLSLWFSMARGCLNLHVGETAIVIGVADKQTGLRERDDLVSSSLSGIRPS